MNKVIIGFGLLVVLANCTNPKQDIETSVVQQTNPNIVIDELQLNQLKDSSHQQIDRLSINGDTLDIVSSGTLTYRPFGVLPFKDSLQTQFGNTFNIETMSLDKHRIYKLSFRESFVTIAQTDSTLFPADAEQLAEYHHQKPDLVVIKEGLIRNKNIQLIDGIHVGMKKRDFFLIVLNSDQEVLTSINTVINGDAPGDHATQYYRFNEDTLSSIEFKYYN